MLESGALDLEVGRHREQVLAVRHERQRPHVLAGLAGAFEERAVAAGLERGAADVERRLVEPGPAHATRHARRAAVHDGDAPLSGVALTPRSRAERDERTKGTSERTRQQMILARLACLVHSLCNQWVPASRARRPGYCLMRRTMRNGIKAKP